MQTIDTPLLGLIILLPLCGALLSYVIGSFKKGLAGWVAAAASFGAFAVVVRLAIDLPVDVVFRSALFTWISSGDLSLEFLLRFDRLTSVMCLVVTGVGSLIHLYAVGYMAHDDSRPRFFAYFNLFLFAMLLLVLGGNLVVLFAGWEGVGLCSYLLIGFWHKNLVYAAAGRKAFVVNRIGDAGFLIGMFMLAGCFGTLDFGALPQAVQQAGQSGSVPFELICFCLFLGAVGKSAQIPLFVWLPDAMAGPTPVSALIHAATMVTAGIYLLARLNFLFALAPICLAVVVIVALLTALMAATIAMTQNDIKKVLAYSTISQLGFMFMAAGAGVYWAAIFHLVTHAFFKACLFMGAGSVIQGCHHEQDMRKLGGLAGRMPWTFATYLVATLAIAGIFPFAGFQSKHAVLAALGESHSTYLPPAGLLVALASIAALLTAFYMTRSLMLTFAGKYRGESEPHESPWVMTLPLVVLAALATVGGLMLAPSLQGYLGSVLPAAPVLEHESIFEGLAKSWIGILGCALGYLCYSKFLNWPARVYESCRPFSGLMSAKYYVDEIYGFVIVRPLGRLAALLMRYVDQGVIDGAVNGAGLFVDAAGEVVRKPQCGRLSHYALYMFMAIVFVIVFGFAF